jgi:outer membrane protein assembly factor BamD (BamD/ComL family)
VDRKVEKQGGSEVKMRQAIITFGVLALAAAGFCVRPAMAETAETWRLGEEGQWQQAAANKQEEFLLRVAHIKKLVDAGQPSKVRQAAKQLKTDFPEIAGADFDSFIEAEVLLAQGKLTKAVKQYDKFLDDYPGSPLKDAALEREFGIASDYLAGRKVRILLVISVRGYDEGVKVMEKISDRAGITDIAKRASLAVAQSYETRHKYNEAYLKWSEISTRWPTGETGRDALLAMARTKYESFRGPAYDGSGLISAKSYYENFKLRYPEEAQKLRVDEILSRINEQLAEKNLRIARYYSRTGSTGPANMYYQMVVDNWPQTKAAQTAREAISKN